MFLFSSHAHSSAEPPTTKSLSAMSSNSVCTKCGTTKKSGKRSCCARGGAWFKKCGYAGDAKLDHTWAEGILACRGSASLTFVKTPVQAMLRHVGVILHPLDNRLRNDTQQWATTSISGRYNTSNRVNTDSTNCDGRAKIVVCIFVLCFILSL